MYNEKTTKLNRSKSLQNKPDLDFYNINKITTNLHLKISNARFLALILTPSSIEK